MVRAWLACGVLISLVAAGPAGAGDDPWAAYRFLMGDWVGEGDGSPGTSSARFSLKPDLQGQVLVRKHRAEVTAGAGRKPAVHEDLMVIYRGEGGKQTRAIYFDSEGHTIHYTASFTADRRTLSFLSDPASAGPRFRLSYTRKEDGTLGIKFEIAPPGKGAAFKTYVEGRARRERP